jgi:hypothetical protein
LSELLVLALRDEGIASRSEHCASGTLPQPRAGEAVDTLFVHCPGDDGLEPWQAVVRELRVAYPRAMLVAVELTAVPLGVSDTAIAHDVDLVVGSFHEAVAFVLAGRVAVAQDSALFASAL